jgi:hypothetical protein
MDYMPLRPPPLRRYSFRQAAAWIDAARRHAAAKARKEEEELQGCTFSPSVLPPRAGLRAQQVLGSAAAAGGPLAGVYVPAYASPALAPRVREQQQQQPTDQQQQQQLEEDGVGYSAFDHSAEMPSVPLQEAADPAAATPVRPSTATAAGDQSDAAPHSSESAGAAAAAVLPLSPSIMQWMQPGEVARLQRLAQRVASLPLVSGP